MPTIDYDSLAAAIPDQPTTTGVGDYGRAAGAGALDIGSNIAALARYGYEQGQSPKAANVAKALQDLFGGTAEDIRGGMSDEARKAASATLTSPEFWDHPVLASTLKLTGMAPSVAALAIPGGLFADAVAASMATAAAGGAVNAGAGIDEFYKKLDAMPDKELQDQSPKYAAMRELMDEKDARAKFTREALGWAPAINAVIGAGAAVVGPAGTAARSLSGSGGVLAAGERGVLGRAAVGGAEGALGNAAQGGVADITSQQADVYAGFQKQIDAAKAANAALEGGAFGGVLGGVAGALLHGRTPPAEAAARASRKLDAVDADRPVATSDVAGHQPQTGATGQPARPTETVQVGDPHNAPTRGDRDGAKAVRTTRDTETPATPPVGPDAAQAAAIGAQEPTTETPDVNAALARLTADQPAPVTPEVARTVQPQGAPPDVAAASQRLAQEAPTPSGVVSSPEPQRVASAPDGVAVHPVETAVRRMLPPEETPPAPAAAPQAAPRTGRVLRDLRQSEAPVVRLDEEAVKERLAGHKEYDEAGQLIDAATGKPIATDEQGNVQRGGKNYGPAGRAKVEDRLNKSNEIIERNKPGDGEEQYLNKPEHRDRVIARARAMVDEATAAGIPIQKVLKRSVKGDAPSDHPATQILTAAKTLLKVADRRKQGKELTEATARFKEDEALIRGGYSEDVLARRRAEGDQKMRRGEQRENVTEDAAVSTSAPRVSDATEVTPEGVVRQKAASPVRKVEITPEMQARYGSPGRAPTKNNGPQQNALRVNTNPTEAQKAAGNYKKGHRRVEGLEFTIENPKGSIRRGSSEGDSWEVRMPADYGYIRRTTGADGDHIDAYDGRSGNRHFIVDQLDHRTGEFDEHKVMLRFKDERAARDAYHAAFSDGRGGERLGHIHEVTAQELKDWLAKGDHEQSHLKHVIDRDIVRDPDKVNFDVPEGPENRRIKLQGGGEVSVTRSSNARDEIAKLNLEGLTGVHGVLAKFFANRLSKLAGDTEVHFVTPKQMEKISIDGDGSILGLHSYDPKDPNERGQIFISTEAREGFGHGEVGHVLLHELVHRVTVRELTSTPGADRMIAKIANVAYKAYHEDTVMHDLQYGVGKLQYGFENTHEFIAEAFSNPHFQEFLANTPIPRELAQELRLGTKSMSMWDVFRGFVKKAIEKVTGKMPEFDSALDAIMKVGEHVTAQHDARQNALRATGEEPIRSKTRAQQDALRVVNDGSRSIMERADEGVRRILEDARATTTERAPFALPVRTFDNIAQLADHYFGENNPVRKIYNALEKMRVKADQNFQKAEPLLRNLVNLRANNAEMFKEFSSLLHDATVANVHPDVVLSDPRNAHLGKKRLVGDAVWAKAQHADLARRWAKLDPDFKEAWHNVTKYYRDQQNAMSLGIIENRILKTLGIEDRDLAKRLHEGNETDADKARLGSMYDVISEAGELSKIEGPYVPLIRRGDHVVKGTVPVTRPGNAKELAPNEFEFTDRKAAEDYAKNSSLKATIQKVWVDENTGELHVADPTTGEPVKVSAKDLHAEPRYRVSVQNEHVEFVDGRAAAERRAAELGAQGLSMHKVVPRRYEVGGRQATELSASLQRLVQRLENSEAYKQATATQKAALRTAIEQAAAASHGSTRIQSKSLPRRGVAGYSEDLVQNMAQYGESSSRYLAKLEHAPELEAGMKQMEDQLKQDESKTNQYGRTAIRNEVVKRVNGDNGFQEGGKYSPLVKRAMALSFIDKLASPAYSVINAMQPAMVTMPYLTGKYGMGRSVAALSRAYNDISAMKIVRQGLRETGRRLKGEAAPDDFISGAKRALTNADERAMIDHMVEHGVVDPSAGMEIRTISKDYTGIGGKVDAGIAYLEGVTREMPRAIEAINRLSTALASYRLERAGGADHATALRAAQDAVNNTQFNYSPTNAPPIFNHPLAKMAFQFKKYGQGMYQLIGSQIGKAYRNASPGDRAAAAKTLIALAGTHMAVAGALGLPTEPFKYLVMASGLFGGPQWGDVEDKIREAAANVFGRTGGEVVTRGLPRLLNLDLSRMGLDSVTSFGEPKSTKESDVKTWLFETISGPVASLGVDYAKGISNIAQGNFEKAAEQLIPIKVASDTLRAYRQATEGKKSGAGRETSKPYNWQETIQRAAGFGSGREAEEGAERSHFYRNSTRQNEQRSQLVNEWVAAKPSEKAAAMAAITRFNKEVPAEVKIKPKDLTDTLRRRQKENNVRGMVTNKRNKYWQEEGERVFNVR